MTDTLQPYPEYKDTGLPWASRVPAHWDSRRMKFLFKEQSQKGFPKEPLLAATQSKGVVRKEDYGLRTVTAINGLENLKLVEVGDFVISLRSFQGGIEVSHARGIISPAYTVLTPREGFEPRYFKTFFKSPAFINSLTLFVTGIREGQNIDYERLSRAFMPLPPPDEQAAIVRFLDHANGRIERAIRAKRKIITLLNEQKQAIIASLVTGKCEVRRGKGEEGRGKGEEGRVKGEDGSDISLFTPRPSHFMKSSGIPWLGDIPAHWSLISLRMRYSIELGKMLDAKRFTGRHSVPYLRNRDVQWDNILIDDLPTMDITPAEFPRYTVHRGDLLVCEGGQVGRCAFWNDQLPICGFQKALHRIRALDPKCDFPRFFFYQMRLAAGCGIFTADGNENTIAHLTCEKLRRHRFAFPPFVEQEAIAKYLDCELQQFETAISNLEREIALLREYRTRLTADVVTGKLDVRREKCEERRVKGEGDWGKEDEAEAMETEEGGEDE